MTMGLRAPHRPKVKRIGLRRQIQPGVVHRHEDRSGCAGWYWPWMKCCKFLAARACRGSISEASNVTRSVSSLPTVSDSPAAAWSMQRPSPGRGRPAVAKTVPGCSGRGPEAIHSVGAADDQRLIHLPGECSFAGSIVKITERLAASMTANDSGQRRVGGSDRAMRQSLALAAHRPAPAPNQLHPASAAGVAPERGGFSDRRACRSWRRCARDEMIRPSLRACQRQSGSSGKSLSSATMRARAGAGAGPPSEPETNETPMIIDRCVLPLPFLSLIATEIHSMTA